MKLFGVKDLTSIKRLELGSNGFALWNATTHYYSHNRAKKAEHFLFADAGKKELQTIQFTEVL